MIGTLRRLAPEPWKRTGRRAVARLGRASAAGRVLPSFVIVGAQRCGTTSLHRMLAAHPAILPPVMHKGIHYFDTAAHYARGLDWYRGHFPLRSTIDRYERRLGYAVITGESSPYYLFHPLAAGRIGRELSAQVIVLLRDPVERAYSAHKQETARGFEDQPFERALELEPERLAGEEARIVDDPRYQSFAHQHHAYVGRGEYAGQLERLYAAVGEDKVFVVETEEMFGPDHDAHWRRLLCFLGLPYQASSRPLRANARPSAPMPATVRARLTAHFDDHDERLAALLGRTPGWRR